MRVPSFDQAELFVLRLILLAFLVLGGLKLLREEARIVFAPEHRECGTSAVRHAVRGSARSP
jgi:hypothetical protein